MDVAISVGNMRAPNSGSHSDVPNMNWPYALLLIIKKRCVDCPESGECIVGEPENNSLTLAYSLITFTGLSSKK
jgi:hypothetical protein